jgi:type II secretory pathway pseudopilin PulG
VPVNDQLNAKCLQYFTNTRPNQGGTLIMLLAIIFISGILAAIALPSLFGQTNKAKQVEARNTIGAINRSQQAYQLEKGVFADSIEKLGVVIPPETANYRYRIIYPYPPANLPFKGPFQNLNGKVFPSKWYEGGIVREFRGSKPVPPAPRVALAIATPKLPDFKLYIGAVWEEMDTATSQSTTRAVLQELRNPSDIPDKPGICINSSEQNFLFSCEELFKQWREFHHRYEHL